MHDETRDYLAEARGILAGRTALLPQREHLAALHEAHEIAMIKTANALHTLTMRLLDEE